MIKSILFQVFCCTEKIGWPHLCPRGQAVNHTPPPHLGFSPAEGRIGIPLTICRVSCLAQTRPIIRIL
ncbi:MAG: hypothetical protein IKU58_02895 [Clostridia bacterium]|nr:hypothetical protein [Clostridia bacterium]